MLTAQCTTNFDFQIRDLIVVQKHFQLLGQTHRIQTPYLHGNHNSTVLRISDLTRRVSDWVVDASMTFDSAALSCPHLVKVHYINSSLSSNCIVTVAQSGQLQSHSSCNCHRLGDENNIGDHRPKCQSSTSI